MIVSSTQPIHVSASPVRKGGLVRFPSPPSAYPVALSTLLAKMEQLEERIRGLEAALESKREPLASPSSDVAATVVLLSSVIATVIDEPHRLHSFRQLNPAGNEACPWALHGRIHLHESRS